MVERRGKRSIGMITMKMMVEKEGKDPEGVMMMIGTREDNRMRKGRISALSRQDVEKVYNLSRR